MVSDFKDAAKSLGIPLPDICLKCREVPSRVETIGLECYCPNCSASWPIGSRYSAPSRIVDGPHYQTVGIFRVLP